MSIYSVRLFFIIVFGFMLLIVANNENSIIDFLCERYQGIDIDQDATDAEKKQFYDDRSECRDNIRLVGILAYLPIVIFQVHCLQTLMAYRATIENKEYQ